MSNSTLTSKLRNTLTDTSTWAIYLFAFLLPGKLAPLNVLAALLVVMWLVTLQPRPTWQALRYHPVFWAFQAYFWMIVLGLLWTEDMAGGWSAVDQALPLAILAPALLTAMTPQRLEGVISAFLVGILVCVILAHYNWFRLHHMPDLPASPWDNPDPTDTAPFTGWVAYAPMLAWAAYLGIRRVIAQNGWWRYAYIALTIAILSNLLFSGGRTGVVAFCALLIYVCISGVRRHRLVAGLMGMALATALIASGYLFDTHFRDRIHKGIDEVSNYQEHVGGSVSSRIVMAGHTLKLIGDHPLIGIGSGDFQSVYEAINARDTPQWQNWEQPHNQFLYTQVSIGVLGSLILLTVYLPLWLRRLPFADGRDDLRIALPVWMISISLFGSYLWDSHINMHFIFFSCLVWCSTAGSVRRQ